MGIIDHQDESANECNADRTLAEREKARLSQESFVREFLELEHALQCWIAKRFGDKELAYDIVQKTFLKLWRVVGTYPISNPKALIYRTAKCLIIDEYRERRRRKDVWLLFNEIGADADNENYGAVGDEKSPEASLQQKQLQKLALAAIAEMAPKVRSVFLMNRFEGLNYHQIAVRLGVSKSSVDKLMIEALTQLRSRVRVHF